MIEYHTMSLDTTEMMNATTTTAPTASHIYKPGDSRLGKYLTEGLDGDVVFVLYACDVGVKRNGGRVGARLGPAGFLHFLQTMGSLQNPEYEGIDLSRIKLTCRSVDLDKDRRNGPSEQM